MMRSALSSPWTATYPITVNMVPTGGAQRPAAFGEGASDEDQIQAVLLASYKEEREKRRRLEPGGTKELAIALD